MVFYTHLYRNLKEKDKTRKQGRVHILNVNLAECTATTVTAYQCSLLSTSLTLLDKFGSVPKSTESLDNLFKQLT